MHKVYSDRYWLVPYEFVNQVRSQGLNVTSFGWVKSTCNSKDQIFNSANFSGNDEEFACVLDSEKSFAEVKWWE